MDARTSLVGRCASLSNNRNVISLMKQSGPSFNRVKLYGGRKAPGQSCSLSRVERCSLQRTRVATEDPGTCTSLLAAVHSFHLCETVSADPEGEETSAASAKVEDSVLVLKTACKTKKVPPTEVFAAIKALEKARLDPSGFLETIGGSGKPRCWMLVFNAGPKVVQEALKGGPGGGNYFPVTAVQQYNAATSSIQNGLYLGPIGELEFMGRFSWSKNKLFFLFDKLSFKLGPLGPFKFNISKKEEQEREPGKKDPFFIWFYADDEIVVGKGRGGGVAVWVRCSRVTS